MSKTTSQKLIKIGTGRIIEGHLGKKEAKNPWDMQDGKPRASTRYLFWKNAPSGCVPYFNYEATFYATIGDGDPDSHLRVIVTGGGGGQTGKNCCVYSIGFDTTGKAYAEEEGQHDPHHHIKPLEVKPDPNFYIGSLKNKTIGIKEILYHKDGHTYLEGWVDAENNGEWNKFYEDEDPHVNDSDLPIIKYPGMKGEPCQEIRFRCDGMWPVDIDTDRTFIAEIEGDPLPPEAPHLMGGTGNNNNSHHN